MINEDKVNGALIGAFIGGIAGIFIYSRIVDNDFDCIEDYNGQIVVDTTEDGKLIVGNGCDYSTAYFPSIYEYAIGDTIGKLSFNNRLHELESTYNKKLDSLNVLKKEYWKKAQKFGNKDDKFYADVDETINRIR